MWQPTTGQHASPHAPAAPGEILSIYVSGLAEGGASRLKWLSEAGWRKSNFSAMLPHFLATSK